MSDPTLPTTSPARRKLLGAWLRFRLRSLLIFITLCTLPLSWAAWRLTSYRQQAQSLSHLTRLANRDLTAPGRAMFEPGTPTWLARFAEQGEYRNVVQLTIDHTPELTDAEAVHLAKFSQLRVLSLDGAAITDHGLRQLSKLSKLQELSLERTAVGDAGLEHLSSLLELRHLDLNDTQVTDAGMKWLAGLPRLEKLQLRNCRITDDGLAQLAQISSLKELFLVNTLVTGDGLKRLGVLPQLEDIEVKSDLLEELDFIGFPALQSLTISGPQTTRVVVSDCPKLSWLRADPYYDDQSSMEICLRNLPAMGEVAFLTTRPRVVRVTNLVGLKRLDLEYLDLEVLELSDLPTLTTVNLRGALVTEKLLQTVADAVPHLKTMDLNNAHHSPPRPLIRKPILIRERCHSRSPLPALTLQPLVDLRNLTHLYLAGTGADDSTMFLLRNHRRLESLNMSRTPVSNEGLRHLQGLTKLTTLRLENTRIGNDGLVHLSTLKRLHSLYVSQTLINDAGLQNLDCLQKLQSLDVSKTNVTKEGIIALRSRLPRCAIGR